MHYLFSSEYLFKQFRLLSTALVLASIIPSSGCKTSPSTAAQTQERTKTTNEIKAALPVPEENRFIKTILSNDLNEPMELAVAPDGRVFFVERSGNFFVYDPTNHQTRLIHHFDLPEKALKVSIDGLLGFTLDPDFRENKFVYFVYTSQHQDQYRQNVARFRLGENNTLDLASEKVLLHYPVFVVGRTHTGGSLAWDKNKNLYISTGDDVLPSQSSGFAPLDERPGRQPFDAQGTSGNTNDLRGKILRIHPEPNGTYTIPQGNLFPAGTPGARPEIYVMGVRNPFRISVDPVNSILYWGEVGPDAGKNDLLGPRGYDEFNQAKAAGNFGWPFFVANNLAYRDYDFATKTPGELFKAEAPVNNSVNNTGLKILPPAQKAFIWYPYEESDEFPGLGKGGRCAMSGPVYHYDAALVSERKLPAYYDQAWFVYDWMRNWIFTVKLDQNQNFLRMEPFMAGTGNFIRPMDMEMGPEGALYILEYGSVYNADNDDARLVRVDYNAGNRAPVAKITVSDTLGIAPLPVKFNSSKSFDFDRDDKLTYEWKFGNGQTSATEANPSFTYTANGIYKAILKVTDLAGKSATDTLTIRVGNTLPQVNIQSSGNASFYFPDQKNFPYNVQVKDREDGTIDYKQVKVHLNYVPPTSLDQVLPNPDNLDAFAVGKTLLENSDCKACHQLEKKAIGPAFLAVSQKYQTDKGAVSRLADKVITGGSGVWGRDAMNAHPQLSKEEATEIIKYVLSISRQQAQVSLPATGKAPLQQHLAANPAGRYILTATYTDRGGAISPLTSRDLVILRPARQQAEEADIISGVSKRGIWMELTNKNSFFGLKNIDLKNISQLAFRYAASQNALLEVRLDSATGPAIGQINLPATGGTNKFAEAKSALVATVGKHDLFFVVGNPENTPAAVCRVDWLEFKK